MIVMTAKKTSTAPARPADLGEVVEDYKFTPKSLYPWETWTDGKARRLTRGKHFHCTTEAMSTACYARGRKLRADGATVHVSCHVEDADHIVIQFKYPDGAPPAAKKRAKTKKAAKKKAA